MGQVEGTIDAQDEDAQGNRQTVQDHWQGETAPAKDAPQPPAPQKVEAGPSLVRQGPAGGQSRSEAGPAVAGSAKPLEGVMMASRHRLPSVSPMIFQVQETLSRAPCALPSDADERSKLLERKL